MRQICSGLAPAWLLASPLPAAASNLVPAPGGQALGGGNRYRSTYPHAAGQSGRQRILVATACTSSPMPMCYLQCSIRKKRERVGIMTSTRAPLKINPATPGSCAPTRYTIWPRCASKARHCGDAAGRQRCSGGRRAWQ